MTVSPLIDVLGLAEAVSAERTGRFLTAALQASAAATALMEAAVNDEPLAARTLERLADAFRATAEAVDASLDEVPGTAGAVHAAAIRFLDGHAS